MAFPSGNPSIRVILSTCGPFHVHTFSQRVWLVSPETFFQAECGFTDISPPATAPASAATR
jgi:hypothetical protein